MIKKLLLLPISLAVTCVNAQDFDWAVQFSSDNYAQGLAIASDNSGNVYTTGAFNGAVDLDPGIGTANFTSTSEDIFISKLDATGSFVWAKQVGSFGGDVAWAITTDNVGDVYVTGNFQGTVDFDPGPGTTSITGVNASDIFVLKLDTDGDFVWVKTFGSTGSEGGDIIKVDASGNIYVAGTIDNGTIDFDPGAGTFNLTGFYDCFLLKLDANGDFVWAKQFTDATDIVHIYGFEFDASGNIYTTGRFHATANFDTSGGTAELTAFGGSDIYVCKLDANGDYLWAKQLGGTNYDKAFGIDLDASNNIYLTGYFGGTADFDPGVGTANLISAGDNDIFVCKLNSAGDYVWVKQFGGVNADYAEDILVSSNGNIYISGAFGGVADFDPTSGTNYLTASGIYDGYCLKLNSSGDFLSVMQFSGSGNDWAQAIAFDSNNNLFMTGWFGGTADLDPTAATANFTTVGTIDPFVIRLKVDDTGIYSNANDHLSVYPNPATSQITIQTTEIIESISIYNLAGELVQSGIQKTISIENLSNGMYLILTKTENGVSQTLFTKQ